MTHPVEKVLIIGPAWIGDMVMAQSLFKLLKHDRPQVLIDVLAPAWTFPLLSRMPEVNQAIEMPLTHGELNLRVRYQLAKMLKKNKYQQAIVLPNSFKSALIPWLANIPKRTGFKREGRTLLLNDARRLDKQRYPLMIDQFMALGRDQATAPVIVDFLPSFAVSSEAQTSVLQKMQLHQGGKPILALCPGAEFGPAKRWPAEYYATVANEKLAEGWQVWLFGSAKDKLITDDIMRLTEQRCVNLAGRTSLGDSIDLLSVVNVVVTNDSGLMHIAAALNKPLIALYGPTSPSFTPPLSSSAAILSTHLDCQPCFARVCPLKHHRCMRELLPEQVIDILSKRER